VKTAHQAQQLLMLSNWLAGDDEENFQIMTDEEIINNVLVDNNSENQQESSTPPIICKIRHNDAMSAFNTCYKWAEENNVQAEDILTLKGLQEKVIKEAFINKRQKTTEAFFCKNAVKALNIELMDKNSQYTFIYVK
jgi:hypothetical protein